MSWFNPRSWIQISDVHVVATRDSWENSLIETPHEIRLETPLCLSETQFQHLKMGFIPQCMEDKWFMFYENEQCYIHRSWTGFGIYQAQIQKTKTGYEIDSFHVERNADKYKNTNDAEDTRLFLALIRQQIST